MYSKIYKYLTILIALIILSCNSVSNDSVVSNKLTLIESIDLKLNEPSGLTAGNSPEYLYVVTDSPNENVHKIDFYGNIIETLKYKGDDLEGITLNPNDSTLWVSEESLLQLVHLDLQGFAFNRIDLDFFPSTFVDIRIEGLTINKNNLILLNEKNPGAIIEIDLDNLSIKNIFYLDFASDYSAICYIEEKDSYIILSDEDQKVFLWNLEQGAIEIYDTGYSKAEGVAIVSNTVCIVSENGNRLYKYSFQ